MPANMRTFIIYFLAWLLPFTVSNAVSGK